MKKYPKIKRIGDSETDGIFTKGKEVIITEKMDGANFRFKIEDGEIWYGSRNVVGLGENKDQFSVAIDYIEENIDPEELERCVSFELGHTNFTYFGECMTPHSLEYDWENVPGFIGFDIYDEKNDKFLDYDLVQDIYKTIDVHTVPIVETLDLKDGEELEDFKVPESRYRDGVAEGVVFKNYDAQIFAKLRSEEFMEENKKAFGTSKKKEDTFTDKFVASYCTNERIKKIIYKLRDEGHDIEMELMQHLPKRVWSDLWEENLNDIIWSNKEFELDMHEARSKVSSRCAKVLKRVITNRKLGDE